MDKERVQLSSDECQILAMYAKHHGNIELYKKLCVMMYQDLKVVKHEQER